MRRLGPSLVLALAACAEPPDPSVHAYRCECDNVCPFEWQCVAGLCDDV